MINWLRNLFHRRKCEMCSSPSQFVKVQLYLRAEGDKVIAWHESIELCGACLKEAIELEEAELQQ